MTLPITIDLGPSSVGACHGPVGIWLRVGAENLESQKAGHEIKGKKIDSGASRELVGREYNRCNGPGMTTYDPALLLEEIRKAKEKCDFVTVYVH